MNEVIVVRNTLTSLEVAEMIGIRHDSLIRKLEGDSKQVGIVATLRDHDFVVTEYFVESTYLDSQNKERKCYEITKKGCEMIAHSSSVKQ